MSTPPAENSWRGIAGSPGIAIGKAFVIDRQALQVPLRTLTPQAVDAEVQRFKDAVEEVHEELAGVRRRVEHMAVKEPRYILDVHLLILEDEMLGKDTEKVIRDDRVNAEWALQKTTRRIKRALADIGDEYLRERATDVDQVAERILKVLLGKPERIDWHVAARGCVLIAHDLSPADAAQMRKDDILAFVTDLGAKTAHTAIIARSLEIPAVVGMEEVTGAVRSGQTVIVDGYSGIVIVDPPAEVIDEYQRRKERWESRDARLRAESAQPAETADGTPVIVAANIDLVVEAAVAEAVGADGVGMFRSEYLFMNRPDLPTEEEQFEAYRELVSRIAPKPTTIRTLDVGGDKLASPLDLPVEHELNPALGLRAVRYGLKEPEMFRTQMRAILRASAFGPTRVLVPMITGLDELRRVRDMFEGVKAELGGAGVSMSDTVELGIMIEVPAAAMIVDLLAAEADFISIGTNDLIQYALAVDRGNEHVAYLYEPLHPAILRLLARIIEAGHQAGARVNMCGEMAGEVEPALVLLGLGLREFSMTATTIPRLKRFFRSVSIEEAREIAAEALALPTAAEVREYVVQRAQEIEPPTESTVV